VIGIGDESEIVTGRTDSLTVSDEGDTDGIISFDISMGVSQYI
jgi:hypothetical protein